MEEPDTGYTWITSDLISSFPLTPGASIILKADWVSVSSAYCPSVSTSLVLAQLAREYENHCISCFILCLGRFIHLLFPQDPRH